MKWPKGFSCLPPSGSDLHVRMARIAPIAALKTSSCPRANAAAYGSAGVLPCLTGMPHRGKSTFQSQVSTLFKALCCHNFSAFKKPTKQNTNKQKKPLMFFYLDLYPVLNSHFVICSCGFSRCNRVGIRPYQRLTAASSLVLLFCPCCPLIAKMNQSSTAPPVKNAISKTISVNKKAFSKSLSVGSIQSFILTLGNDFAFNLWCYCPHLMRSHILFGKGVKGLCHCLALRSLIKF